MKPLAVEGAVSSLWHSFALLLLACCFEALLSAQMLILQVHQKRIYVNYSQRHTGQHHLLYLLMRLMPLLQKEKMCSEKWNVEL